MTFIRRIRELNRLRNMKGTDIVKLQTQPAGKRCQYPHGDPGTKAFRFCYDPVTNPRFPYCDKHARLCYANYDTIKSVSKPQAPRFAQKFK